ncbi:MAG: DUF1043 family protein [Myxococcales bacterium]|nr:DUF1043 family protein [Myxococcales bacterium]MDH5305709.1 DUF1043 family protein [Myxococcales bacterium]MDH5565572.1 DUF1043 family protein [Myxococcales bacterium]
MTPNLLLYLASSAAIGLALGFVFGRRTARDTRRIRDLEAHVEHVEKEREQTQAELAAARDAFETYRGRVADHFAGTSELLRDLTQRYRGVYAHLAAGAEALCPAGFAGLEEGFAPGALASGEAVARTEGDAPPLQRSGEAAAAEGPETPVRDARGPVDASET